MSARGADTRVLEASPALGDGGRGKRGKFWKLRLECGHTVMRVRYGPQYPRRVRCEECLLDRLFPLAPKAPDK